MDLVDGPLSAASIASLEAVAVADITNPTELNAIAGTVVGERRVCYQVIANDNIYTVYFWDSADGTGASTPYVVAGSSGFWIAAGGRYTNSAVSLRSTLAVAGNGTVTGLLRSDGGQIFAAESFFDFTAGGVSNRGMLRLVSNSGAGIVGVNQYFSTTTKAVRTGFVGDFRFDVTTGTWAWAGTSTSVTADATATLGNLLTVGPTTTSVLGALAVSGSATIGGTSFNFNSPFVVGQFGGGWTTAKFDSQGTLWTSRTLGGALIFNGGAADRYEIDWYRGSRSYPEFAIREATTADSGGEIWAGAGTVAPQLVAKFVAGTGNMLVGTSTDDGVSKLQVSGSATFSARLGIGGTPNTYAILDMRYAASWGGATFQNAIYAEHAFDATVATGRSFGSGPIIPTGAAATNLFHYWATDATGSGTVGNQYGVYIESLTKGTNNFAIFSAGTTASALGGLLTVNSTTTVAAGYKLQVNGAAYATSGVDTGSTAWDQSISASSLVVGNTGTAAITNTTCVYVGWCNATHPLNASGQNGDLLLAARLSVGAISMATNNTVRLKISSAGASTFTGRVEVAQTSGNNFLGQGTGWMWSSDGTSAGTLRGGIYAQAGNTINLFTGTNASIVSLSIQSNGRVLLGNTQTDRAARVQVENLLTLTGAVGDEFDSGAVMCAPSYTGAFTVSRAAYVYCRQPLTAASAAVTDACVFFFDAAAGTHKAVDSGTTKTTPGSVSAWVKISINGTVHYMPAYTSKTT